jgi:membrane complex biogenesis BtpA family protein
MKTETEFNTLFGTKKPIIGMIHLRPLPGSPLYNNTGLGTVIDEALEEATIQLENGINALNIENYNDMSYFPDAAPAETVASMAIVAHEIRKAFPKAVLGICTLSDPVAGLAIAHSIKAQFIRATFFTEASVDVSGLVLRRPHEILRFRKFLDPSIMIFADVHIKHSAPLAVRPIEESAYDAAYFLADAVIVSGKHTGFPTNIEDVKKVRAVLPDFPILVGSGANKESIKELFRYASGAIVGTSLKRDGKSENPVDEQRVKDLMKATEEVRATL